MEANKLGAQILIIEDDLDLSAEITDFLRRRRNTVRACATLAEAEQALQEMHPDVVMSDICLPDGDGASFFVTHAGAHTQAKWLLMSGNQDLVRQGNRLGAEGDASPFAVLDKPVPLRLLDRFIRSAKH